VGGGKNVPICSGKKMLLPSQKIKSRHGAGNRYQEPSLELSSQATFNCSEYSSRVQNGLGESLWYWEGTKIVSIYYIVHNDINIMYFVEYIIH
jgi:hypothetical protein